MHPKEATNNNVDEFLDDNREYLEQSKKKSNAMDDSEIPDEYYDEDEMDSSAMSDRDANGRGILSQSSSSMSSVQESP